MKKLLTVIALMLMNPAMSADLDFSGTVATSCSLNINQTGTMTIAPSNPTILGTGSSGGAPGIVGVSYLGTPTITVTLPNAFTSSPTITFAPTFSGVAVSNILGTLSFTSGVASGAYSAGNTDTVSVGLQASSGGSDSFPTGAYSAVVTVTCS